MNEIRSKWLRACLCMLAPALLQACSTFRTCADIVNDERYVGADDYKAVASYFDIASDNPPASEDTRYDECWYRIGAPSQDIADAMAMEVCKTSLAREQVQGDWECRLIAQGVQLTGAEAERIAKHKFIGTTHMGQILIGHGTGSYNIDNAKTAGEN